MICMILFYTKIFFFLEYNFTVILVIKFVGGDLVFESAEIACKKGNCKNDKKENFWSFIELSDIYDSDFLGHKKS
jgi:hypothetical protein